MNDNIFFDKSKLKHCGKNVIIGKTVRIRHPEKISIGDNVIIDDFTYISGDVTIGDYVHVGAGCVFSASSARITIGPLVGISAGCKIYGGSSNYVTCGLDIPTIPKEHQFNVILEDVNLAAFALIGASSIILPGCRIPQGFAVAAAVTVRKKLELEPWNLLLDEDGTQIPRKGISELKARVSEFYEIEIDHE